MTVPRAAGSVSISVVTPSLNQARYIEKNILSVLEQGLDGVEHIVVDGGSGDGTLDILARYPQLVCVSEPDSGQSEALNKGIARARGEWICWVNSDDYLLPGALPKFIDYIQAHPAARFVYSCCRFVDAEGSAAGQRSASYLPKDFPYWWRQGGAGFAQPGSFFKKSLWETYGPFDERLHYMMDYDFWLRIHGSVEFCLLDDYLVAYRLHDEAKTAEGWRPFVEEGVAITRRYWDETFFVRKWQMRFLVSYMYAMQMLKDSMRLRVCGDERAARRLCSDACKVNWLPLLSLTYGRYCLFRLLGPARYAKLSVFLPGLRKLHDALGGAEGESHER